MEEYTAEQIAQAAKAALEQGDTQRAQRLIAYGRTLTGGSNNPPAPRVPVTHAPDGRRVAPNTTAQEAEALPPGMIWNEDAGYYVDTSAIARQMGNTQGLASSFLAGTLFAGESVDEGMGALGGMMGMHPEAVQETMRQSRQQFQDSNPGMALAAEVAGGVASSMIPATRLANWVNRGRSLLGKGLRGAAVMAPVGAVEGMLQGYGSGTTPETRAENALSRGLITSGISGAIGLVSPGVAAAGAGAAEAIFRRIKSFDVDVIANALGISAPAARIVKEHLINDDLDAVVNVMARKGDDALLAEAGPATSQLLDTVMSGGGRALSEGRRAVDGRIQGAASNWQSVLNNTLGDASGGIREAGRQTRTATAAQREQAYRFAYNQPTPMVGRGGVALQAVLNRIDPEDLQAAMREAAKQARDDGYVNMNYKFTFNADGTVNVSQPPSIMDLDYLVRGLQSMRSAGTDSISGRMTDAARRAGNQATALRAVLKDHVPGYSKAVKLGADNAAASDALVMGRSLLSQSTRLEDVALFMRGASDATRAAMARGVRENIEAVSGRARATIRDLEAGNIDFEAGTNVVGEAVDALRAMARPENIRKLQIAIGKPRAKLLFDALEKQADAMVLAAAVARTTATAIRRSGQEAIADEVAPGALRSMAGEMGSPLDAARPVTRALAGTDPASLSRAKNEYFAEIARALTSVRGPEARRALALIKASMDGQPGLDAQLDSLLTGLGIPTFAALHQLGVQSTTQ